ncbi:hypothetical protein ANRL4_03088 [Anaerolineae bacterium]|nr:hypothetical protein ANRL4_03088 [Anaerolineae bacterium]
MKRLITVLTVLAVLFWAASMTPALAGGPDKVQVDETGGDLYTCDNNGDGVGDYQVEGHFWAKANIWFTYDASGNIIHIKVTFLTHGQLTNLQTGQVYKDHRAGQENGDYRDMEYTHSGNSIHLINPGEGTVFRDAGRIVINLINGEVVWERGNHEATFSVLDVCGWVGDGVVVGWQPLP